MRSVVCVRNHGVRWHQDPTFACKLGKKLIWLWYIVKTNLFFLVGSEHSYLPVGHIWPLKELLSPLHNWHPEEIEKEDLKDYAKTYDDVQSTRHDFLIVQAAVIPTRVLPAPHGNTMIPERARLFKIWSGGLMHLVNTRTRFRTSCSDWFLGKAEWPSLVSNRCLNWHWRCHYGSRILPT